YRTLEFMPRTSHMALKLNSLLLDRPKGMQRPRLLKGGGCDVVPSQVRRTTEKKTPEEVNRQK
ncbi:uncharacterized, partial [Tachysurus ichikawai]